MSSTKDLRVLSLFSGCGGMDLGFDGDFEVLAQSFGGASSQRKVVRVPSTRFKLVFANDIMNDAKTAWSNYFIRKGYSPDLYHLESIISLVRRHQMGEEVFPQNIDVVIGGFPCQDFSLSGKRKGFKSEKDHLGNHTLDSATEESRGMLYYWMKRVIEIVRPKIFVAENVRGLVNLENVKDIIQKDFSLADNEGYIVLPPKILHAADYGVPQSRERVFFIGIKKSALTPVILKELLSSDVIPDKLLPYPKPTHKYTPTSEGLLPPVNLREVFADLEEPENSSDKSQQQYSKAKYMGGHCQGQKEISLDRIAPTIRSEHHGNIEFRRLSESNGGIMTDELALGMRERRLTPRECALIQTFPPDYDFVLSGSSGRKRYDLSPSAAYKIIGNAVPPLLAYHIAKRLEDLWETYFH
ncbi:modification methylase [Porphyromonas sp. COT-290 OH860]|nr:modification methylase [Porphyromonas sp. COT-290 OH860]